MITKIIAIINIIVPTRSKKECTNNWMEKLKAAKTLTRKKVGDFEATFGILKRVTIMILNGWKNYDREKWSKKGWYGNNHWNDHPTDKEDSQL